jgi:hypothetical protein
METGAGCVFLQCIVQDKLADRSRQFLQKGAQSMASRHKGASSSKSAHSAVLDAVKMDVSMKASELIETVLKPKHIQAPPDNPQFNYF